MLTCPSQPPEGVFQPEAFAVGFVDYTSPSVIFQDFACSGVGFVAMAAATGARPRSVARSWCRSYSGCTTGSWRPRSGTPSPIPSHPRGSRGWSLQGCLCVDVALGVARPPTAAKSYAPQPGRDTGRRKVFEKRRLGREFLPEDGICPHPAPPPDPTTSTPSRTLPPTSQPPADGLAWHSAGVLDRHGRAVG